MSQAFRCDVCGTFEEGSRRGSTGNYYLSENKITVDDGKTLFDVELSIMHGDGGRERNCDKDLCQPCQKKITAQFFQEMEAEQ
jgi:hypothetical protein